MSQGYFLNPTLIREISLWYSNSRENLVVFEPLAKACLMTGKILASHSPEKGDEARNILEDWCSGSDFFSMISEAAKSNSSISIDLARESLAHVSRSDSFIAGLPANDVLAVFSALVRADLRSRESRSSAHIDELFLYQSQFRHFGLHDVCLLFLAKCLAKETQQLFDLLLLIKDDRSALKQIPPELLQEGVPVHFASGLRMFAIGNLDDASNAFALAGEKGSSGMADIAQAVVALFNNEKDRVFALLERASSNRTDSLADSIRNFSKMIFTSDDITIGADDTESIAGLLFFLIKSGQHTEASSIAEKHIESHSNDIIIKLLWADAIIAPIRKAWIDDPPVPGCADLQQLKSLRKAKDLLIIARQEADSLKLPYLKAIANINLTVLFLMLRDFITAEECGLEAVAAFPQNSLAKLSLGTALLAIGDLPKMMETLSDVAQEHRKVARRLRAEAHYHNCSFEQAIQIWNDLDEDENERLWRLRILCRKLESYRLIRDEANAQKSVDILMSVYKNEPETLFAIAYELWQMGRNEDAIHALKISKEIAAPNLKRWISWELGRVLFDSGQVLTATDEYASVADPTMDTVQGREFAVALYKAGLLPAAGQRARGIREAKGEVVPGITEIETDLLVREGKLAEAKELLIQLSIARPYSVLNRLAIVRVCIGLNQLDEARAQLQELCKLNLSPEMRDEVQSFANDLKMDVFNENT